MRSNIARWIRSEVAEDVAEDDDVEGALGGGGGPARRDVEDGGDRAGWRRFAISIMRGETSRPTAPW